IDVVVGERAAHDLPVPVAELQQDLTPGRVEGGGAGVRARWHREVARRVTAGQRRSRPVELPAGRLDVAVADVDGAVELPERTPVEWHRRVDPHDGAVDGREGDRGRRVRDRRRARLGPGGRAANGGRVGGRGRLGGNGDEGGFHPSRQVV